MEINVGENIAKYRKINGISQKHLAKKIEISQQGLFKIERGQVSPKADTLIKIILITGLTPNQLFGMEKITEDNSSIINRFKELSS